MARLARVAERALIRVELTLPQYRMLSVLAMANAATPSRVAWMLSVKPATVTAVMDGLVAGGYVRREPDPNDRRGVLVELTDAGRRLYEDSVGAQARKEELVAAALSESEKRQLNALLRRLMLEFERAEAGSPSDDAA